MTYFLAEVTISISHYSPEDFGKDGEIIKKHLVSAKNETEVHEKVMSYYKEKTEDSFDGTRYHVIDITVFETIV